MRAISMAGTLLSTLAIIAPAQAQGPSARAAFAAVADTTAADGLRARLDTAWLGASLLTPIAAPTESWERAPDTARPEAYVRDTMLPCIEIECLPPHARPKRFWRGAGELVLVQLIPFTWNRFIRNEEWARISLQSWADNLRFPWYWDDNQFLNNQFAHPFHGALYFASARTNGYNFWQSAPWTFAGSLMWELFGEVWAPSPNDLLMTSLGGISLGEMLSRVSALTLDNESSGTERVFREIGAAIIEPVRAFNRAVDGTMFQRSRNPEEWRPSTVFANVEAGYRIFSLDEGLSSDAATSAYVGAALVYGSPLHDLTEEPFSHFRLNTLLSVNPGPDSRFLSELNVRGGLAGKKLGGEESRSQLAAFMTYEYQSNPMVEFGAQGFQGGWVHATSPTRGPMLYLDAVGIVNPIAAVRSDYYITQEGRDYDYGLGFGGRGEARAVWQGKAIVGATANYRFIPVLSGFPAQHQLLFLNAEARYFIQQRWGLGVAYNQLWRWSTYFDRSDVNRKFSELRLFLATAIPQWEELK